MTLPVFLIIVDILVALGIGLVLRRLVVRKLRNSVLDKWLIQTLGILVIVPLLVLAIAIAPVIWDNTLLVKLWENFKNQLGLQSVTQLVWNVVESLLILAIGIGIARTLMRLSIRGLGESHIDINIRTLIGRVFYILVLTFVAFWILSIWQVSIGIPVAALGIITVAFTVAVQDILKDLVAGFYILVERPFHIGDLITVTDLTGSAGRTGRVEDVQLRTTRMRLTSGQLVSVPNTLVFSGVVINNSFFPDRRGIITITMSEGSFEKEETPDKIIGALQEIETIMPKPEPTVALTGASAGKLTLTVRFWIANGHTETDRTTISEVMYALRSILPDTDLTVSEPAGNV